MTKHTSLPLKIDFAIKVFCLLHKVFFLLVLLRLDGFISQLICSVIRHVLLQTVPQELHSSL